MQDHINEFLNENSDHNTDVVHVECRSTGCEIQAFIHDADAYPTGWDRMIGNMMREDWFDFRHGSNTGSENVRMAVYFLEEP